MLRTTWGWVQTLWDRTEGFRGFLVGALALAFDVVIGYYRAWWTVIETAWGWAKLLWDRTEGFRGFLVGALAAGFGVIRRVIDGHIAAFTSAWQWAKLLWDRTEGFRGFLVDAFATGVNTAKTVLGGFRTGFQLLRDAIQWVIDKIESLIGWIDRIPSPGDILGGLGDLAGGALSSLPGLAGGGPTPTGTPFWVGEEGPELMYLNRTAWIADAQTSAAVAASDTGGGHGDVLAPTINHYGQTVTPDTVSAALAIARLQK
jgi:hypothetical protein